MNIRLGICILGLFSALAALIVVPGYAPKETEVQQANRPNIIFIFSDDHAYQAISAYGSKLTKTPNIDRIAREGAILHNNVVTNSICGPSRATLLTGKFSHLNGYKANEGKFAVNQSVFPEELKKNGYQTAWVGKMHLGTLPNGFDYLNVLPGQGHYYSPDFINSKRDTVRYPGYVSNVITKLSLDWLNQRDKSKPFFMVVGHKATHREWLPDLRDLGAYDKVNFPLPATFYDNYEGREAAKDQDMTIDKTMRLKEDLKVHADYVKNAVYKRFSPEEKKVFYEYYENKISKEFDEKKLTGKALVEWKYQRYLKDYLATANALDRNIGELLNYLDKSGLAKNTVVVYASDQGFYLGEHGWFDKRFIYEQSLKTPFVIRYPGVIKPGTQINELISNIDWAPTLLNLTGTAIPKDIQGESFLPLLTGKKVPWRQEAYYHYYEYPVPHHVYPHFGLRGGQYKLVRFYGPKDFWELYDLKKDPQELHNIYGVKGYEAVTADLKTKLKDQIRKYKDDEALKIVESGQ
ncbi:sulfatase family protein [Larkinella terrae]|uniref:Sulfatase-like hydrolase/transferase n=1 Tax=Larkinella terrae TaxID=2025311 RepID=A0A7K0EN77_9BACT|nr:sulfatase [Larkinella terrae]MRS63303.1 sulfatase-like hydrolase/transferase [Larkinella terrae]